MKTDSLLTRQTYGFGYAIMANMIWGMYPFFWIMLVHVPYQEMLAHRMIWSLVAIILILPILEGFAPLKRVLQTPKFLLLLMLNAVLISVNWGLYIYSIYAERIIESSLGYYMSPIFAATAAMIFLGERLRGWQYLAVALIIAGIILALALYGSIPWISIGVAMTFALYSTIKRKILLPSLTSLGFEVLPAALIGLWYVYSLDGGMVPDFTPEDWFWVTLTGPMTVLPLVLFGLAVNRAPLMPVALLFYIVPTCLFFISVFAFGEAFKVSNGMVFVFVWVGVILFALQTIKDMRESSRAKR